MNPIHPTTIQDKRRLISPRTTFKDTERGYWFVHRGELYRRLVNSVKAMRAVDGCLIDFGTDTFVTLVDVTCVITSDVSLE